MLREGLEELHVAEAGELADLLVDTAGSAPAVLSGHEVAREEAHLLVGLHAAAHRRPEAVDEEARQARRARAREPALGLPVVEGEMPRLVAHDAGEELAQDGVAGYLGEALVADQRGELVDRAPGHVHADEVGPEPGDHGGRPGLGPLEDVLPRAWPRH